MTGLREDEREALLTALAMLLHDHRPEPLLPPLLVSGCKCGWGSEVFSHSAHQANEVGKYLAARAAQTDAATAHRVTAEDGEALRRGLPYCDPDCPPNHHTAACDRRYHGWSGTTGAQS